VPRTCTVCSHPARENIDSSLVRRIPYRDISKRFDVSESALSRHLNEHLSTYVQQALSEYAASKGVKVLDKLGNTLNRLDGFLDAAEEKEDAREFVTVAAELRKELELIAKLQGELAQEGTTNILVNAEYVEARALIIRALEPYPDARKAVVSALGETNGDG
jgi:DNA-binding transcriptional ArsR family regulator